ncbi:MAG TPA: competence/damage-inducible protein A [Clostridiaceae bacterium]|nr:competence/damage-inducible protein A [Clostridiaceae bacterium]
MNAEILAVGTELLMGQIANTNAQYITGRLPEAGINVYFHTVVGDNRNRLMKSLDIALERSDVVIITGGLGPTQDDITKETVSEKLGLKLVLHEDILEEMKSYFQRLNRTMAPNNIKQALLPEGCIVVKNKNGTAPGCIIEHKDKIIVLLPGPPSEMKPMFDDIVMKYFMDKSSSYLKSKYIRIFGIGESDMEDRISDLVSRQTNPTIAPYAKEGEVTLRITAKYDRNGDDVDIIEPVINNIQSRLGDYIYSTENENMENIVAKLLMDNNISISIAESCTGGIVSGKLTDIPGISSVYFGGMIVYSNEAKIKNLQVKQETIEKYGAVSKETATEMAENIRKIHNTHLGLSITGIAGPDGGTPEKPVGLVYIGLSDGKNTQVKEIRLSGERRKIRNITSLHALDMVRRYVLNLLKQN